MFWFLAGGLALFGSLSYYKKYKNIESLYLEANKKYKQKKFKKSLELCNEAIEKYNSIPINFLIKFLKGDKDIIHSIKSLKYKCTNQITKAKKKNQKQTKAKKKNQKQTKIKKTNQNDSKIEKQIIVSKSLNQKKYEYIKSQNLNNNIVFYHITNLKDLLSMINDWKLMCRNKACEKGSFEHNENIELTTSILNNTDNIIKNYARLFLNKNFPTLYYFKKEANKKNNILALLKFNSLEILKRKNIQFCEKVATKASYFIEEGSNYEKYNKVEKSEKSELLIPESISFDFLKEIEFIFPNNKKELNDYELFSNIKEKMKLNKIKYIETNN